MFDSRDPNLGFRRSDITFGPCGFVERSSVELEADAKLLPHYQTCMEIVVKSLKDQGGQLRQFIVDDKGTVFIGSFGLRGSVSHDNAAAAVESALNTLQLQQEHELDAGIGITIGKAY